MDESQKLSRTLWIGVGLIIVLVAVAYVLSRFQGSQRGALESAPISKVSDFTLTNQIGEAITLADLRGQVWVADIVFTRCAGPCPEMTRRMKLLQDALPADSRAKLVTLTTDPEFDTPEVMRKYAARFGADSNRWLFLTGTKEQIASLAQDSLKLSGVEVSPEQRANPQDLFIHSTYFVIVDKNAQVRKVLETAGPDVDWTEVQARILATIRKLEAGK
jgi:cytochrome oxidase Cu insertion factor (SCO1/SenC/PrrC family)